MKHLVLALLLLPALAFAADPAAAPAKAKPKGKAPNATITMENGGKIELEFFPSDAPKHVENFITLANKGFYDGLTFHRVAKDFAVQGGDPAGTGSGGPGYSVRDPVPAGVTYTMGTVAMAKTGAEPPGTSGSQFFIVPTAGAARGYTPDYAILGHVTSGQDAVTKMNALAPASGDGPPIQPIYIEKVTVTSA